MTFPPSAVRQARPLPVASPSSLFVMAGLALSVLLLLLVTSDRIYQVHLLMFDGDSHLSPNEEGSVLALGGSALAFVSVWALATVLRIRGRARWLLAGFFTAIGATNGWLAGYHGIYDWSHISGYLAFVSDSSTGLVGTTIGVFVHGFNHLTGAELNPVSHRRNMFVYNHGLGFSDYALTQGNVVSHLRAHYGLLDHESLHVWQSRAFGPVFQAVYALWTAGGAVVGTVQALLGHGSVDHNVTRLAYESNPWEVWAYSAA
jgi:hypothetical protein